jgi:hypothetical protein
VPSWQTLSARASQSSSAKCPALGNHGCSCYIQSIETAPQSTYSSQDSKERLSRMGDDTKSAVRAVETGERKDRILIVED